MATLWAASSTRLSSRKASTPATTSTRPFAHRPDCIYDVPSATTAPPRTTAAPASIRERNTSSKISAGTPSIRNGRVLLAQDFRYFGAAAPRIPARLHLLNAAAESLGQGHRVFTERDPESREADALFRHLWKRPTAYTPGARRLRRLRPHSPQARPLTNVPRRRPPRKEARPSNGRPDLSVRCQM